jgi:hypothetical protein
VHHHEGERNGTGLFPGEARRHRDGVGLVDEPVLGKAAGAAAHHALAGAEHLSRRLLPRRLGRPRGDEAMARDQLAAVQARSLDLHEQLVRTRLWRRHLAQLELHALACAL